METGPELSIIVPTFNEADNAAELLRRLDSALDGVRWEVIFVDDDSSDGTADTVRALAASDPRVRLIQRIGRRGLSTACVEGMLSSSAPYLGVMDADLQHDETILPQMLAAVRDGGHEIAVGSRHVSGGSVGEWDAERQNISRLATRLAGLVIKADLKDPMSGFFLLRREVLHEAVRSLSGIGFKILLDIFASIDRPLRFVEIPYTFRERQAGESKLDSMVAWEYVMMLLDKTLGRYVPVRFIPFAFIGGLGVFVHMAVLYGVFQGLYGGAEERFVIGQTVATLVAMTFNFLLNNRLTYRDRRLRGWAMLRGWLSFTIACSLGALANVGIATYLFRSEFLGHIGWVMSAVAGILVGAVWNYAVTSVYTWNKPKPAS
ncbi:MAG: glycosyltransferase [Gammaproteobacteria bacterium]